MSHYALLGSHLLHVARIGSGPSLPPGAHVCPPSFLDEFDVPLVL
jgi:hypothetical protein